MAVAVVVLILLSIFHLSTVNPASACFTDVRGSYGDARDLYANTFAPVVGVACGGACYKHASVWSWMAIQHGDTPVRTTDSCRKLCLATPGCQVWTYNSKQQSCTAMRTLSTSPALATDVPNTTTGRAICLDNSTHFLPFPESLSRYLPHDFNDPCFRPGYLYGDGEATDDARCSNAPLLAVHAPQTTLDMGIAQGWWEAVSYQDPKTPTTVQLIATPNNQPYSKAETCAKACVGACGGFSLTHGICFLRGTTASGSYNTANTSCLASNAAVRSDALAGSSFADRHGACVRLERTVPQPIKTIFDQCDVPRCAKMEDANSGEFLRWDLPAPYEAGTRDFAFHNGRCYFPAFNRSEIRTLLGGVGAKANTETWVIITGGSNSYGMGATVIKAVHNSGGETTNLVSKTDPVSQLTFLEGYGISETEASTYGWETHAVVDTIRFPDGRTVVRKRTSTPWNLKTANKKYDDATMTSLTDWLEEMNQLFTPGAIRVTHVGIFYFNAFQAFVNLVGLSTKKTSSRWKRVLFWGHNIQRTDSTAALDTYLNLADGLASEEACNRPGGTLCAIGTKYPSWVPGVATQKKYTWPNSPIHLLDVSHIAKTTSGKSGFEFNDHALQSLHVLMFQILLNSYDLDISLSTAQRTRELARKACPEALRLPKRCNSAQAGGWNTVNGYLCDFDRDEITPKFGLPAFQSARLPLAGDGSAEGSGSSGGGDNSGTGNDVLRTGVCGIDVDDINLFNAIQRHGNVSKIKDMKRTAALQNEDTLDEQPPLCRGRLWCGYETDSWAVGLGAAFFVGVWWTCTIVFKELQRDQQSEVKRLKNINETTIQAGQKQPRRRRASLDPGNGGVRNRQTRGHRNNNRSIVSRKELQGLQSNDIVGSIKPLSTAVGERLTSLGPARFMASMHIVAGHLYQKSAVGPMYFLSWGFTWVPWFFMLSGYVLMHARLNSRTPNRVDAPLTALWKRTSSIFPMYAIGVVLDMVAYLARGSPLPAYYVLIAQSFLLQGWVSYFTEKALQTHCWFLSAMVVYWLFFGPMYRLIRKLSLKKTLAFLLGLSLLPWLAVIIPAAMNDLAFYKDHRTGSLKTPLDHVVVTLKFSPLCYVHVFMFGMLLARFRRHVTRREDSFETNRAQRPMSQYWLLVPFRAGALIGYVCLIVTFLSLKEASAAKAKISARLGILMPLQGMILLGLSPLRGLAKQPSESTGIWIFQSTGADPVATLFNLAPSWLGDVSYSQYVLQILAYTVWPVKLNVFGRWGFVPFFAFLQGVSFFTAMTIQTPARKAWMRPFKAKQGRWMLIWPIALSILLCICKGVQEATLDNNLHRVKNRQDVVLPDPYIELQAVDFFETNDPPCAFQLYGSGGNSLDATHNLLSVRAAVDVKLNWSVSTNTLKGFSGTDTPAIINPSILLIPSASAGSEVTYTMVRAARVHEMEQIVTTGVLDVNSTYLNGSSDRNIIVVKHYWHSNIIVAKENNVACDFTSWDPKSWKLSGPGAAEFSSISATTNLMKLASIVTSRLTLQPWKDLCRTAPYWIPENKTLVYSIVTGPEDPKLFLVPWKDDRLQHQSWAILFSSLPPVDTIAGGAAQCDSTKKASVQMYVTLGVPELLKASTSTPPRPAPAGVRLECAKKQVDEKNWIPFTVGSSTHFVYSLSPHVVLTGRPVDGACVKSYSTSSFSPLNVLAEKIGAHKIHGSGTAERFGPDRFLGLMHTKLSAGNGYVSMFYLFSNHPPFEILAISRPIPLSGGGLAFPSGLIVLEKQGRVLITYGVNDAESRAMLLTRVAVRNLFTWRGCSNHDLEWWNDAFPNDVPSKVAVASPTLPLSATCEAAATKEYRELVHDLQKLEAKKANQAVGVTNINVNDESCKISRAEKASLEYPECTICENCFNSSYCAAATTEVFYSCPPGYTPQRLHLSLPWLNILMSLVGILCLVGICSSAHKYKTFVLEKEYALNPSVRNDGGGKVKTFGATFVWFYLPSPDGELDPTTGVVKVLGPYTRDDMKEALVNGNIWSSYQVCGTDHDGTSEWCAISEVAGFPPSEAAEWYSLGEDSMVEGPFKWSNLKGWYDSGAVAPDLLMGCGECGEWKELRDIMLDADAEAAATVEREETERMTHAAKERKAGKKSTEVTPKRNKMKISLRMLLGKGGTTKKRNRKQQRLEAMWYIFDDATVSSIGPYLGSMLHSWLYWGNITGETLVAVVGGGAGRLGIDAEHGGEDGWVAVATVFGEEALNALQDDNGNSGGAFFCCCCTNGSNGDDGDDGDDGSSDDGSSAGEHDGIELTTTQQQQRVGSTDTCTSSSSFNDYKKRRHESGAFSPPNFSETKNDETLNWDEQSKWVEHVNEIYQQYYYYNESTRSTQWEAPNGGYQPCPWRIQIDDSGKAYYYNRLTMEVAWEITKAVKEQVKENETTSEGTFTNENPMIKYRVYGRTMF